MKNYIDNFKLKWKNIVSIKKWVVQKYIDNPLLLNNKKFHMRCNIMLGKLV